MITGLDVTTGDENHYTYPGAFLSAMSANFNITYNSSGLTILPRDLIVNIESFTTTYGEVLTVEKLIEETTFAGWAFEGEYQESVATVFPDNDGGVPFYFIKVGGDGTELEFIELDLQFSEEKEAKFIINSYKLWQEIKEDLLKILKDVNIKSDTKSEPNNKGYFG